MTVIIFSLLFIVVFALLMRLINKKPKRKKLNVIRKELDLSWREAKWIKEQQELTQETKPIKKKRLYDTTINPFKIWHRVKRGKKVYYIKSYLSNYRSKFQPMQVIK